MISSNKNLPKNLETFQGISNESASGIYLDETCNLLADTTVSEQSAGGSPGRYRIRSRPAKCVFVPAVKASAFVKTNLCNPAYAVRYAAVVADAMVMTKGELQSRYKAEYTSLRSRRQQSKSRHIRFSDSLKDIRDWLIHIGPIPAKGWTVDRIKLDKTGYHPGNLRWATKGDQTRNRKVTHWHQLPDGSRLTTMQLASRLGLTYLTVYKRLRGGWTLSRLLQQDEQPSLKSWKFPPEFAQHCQPLYQQRKYHPQHRLDWFIEYLANALYNKLDGKWGMVGKAIPNLLEHLDRAKADRKNILKREKELEEQKLTELLIILDPPEAT